MKQQDAFALGRSNLNGFLFADIGVEHSGMPLSVLSALARQGLDPWHEAGRLAKLPRITATDGLARLIATMPSSLWPLPDANAIAVRLIALLPGQSDQPVGAQSSLSSPLCLKADSRQSAPWLIIAILVMVLLAALAVYVAPASTSPATVSAESLKSPKSAPTGR